MIYAPTTQMFIFIPLAGAGVLFDGAFLVSILNIKNKVRKTTVIG